MKRLHLHLFGAFQATWDGDPLTGFRSDKARALLTYLAVEGGRPHRRETLGALLWGEQAGGPARASLRSVLYNLRQMLDPLTPASDPPLLTVTRQSVTFHVDHPLCRVDVVEFDDLVAGTRSHLHSDLAQCPTCVGHMARLVDLYRGDLLAGLTLPDGLAFDEWRLLQQEARHRQVIQALSAVIAYHSAEGHYDQAARYAQRQIELAPWNEAAHVRLMTALALSGHRNAALRQYESCRRILQSELGVEPDAETTVLYQRIRAREFGWDEGAGAEPENPYKGLQPFREADASDFHGREILVSRLLQRMGEELREEVWMVRFMALVGPSGSGKSSTVRAGLIPALRRTSQGGGVRWWIATMFPGADPLVELRSALDEVLPPGRGGETLAQTLARRLPEGDRLLLVIDQAEELFILTQDEDVRRGFIADLLSALRAPDSRLHVVMTLRADYYAHPLQSPDWGQLFAQRVEFALPLSAEALQRTIEGPADRVGVRLEADLVSTLVTDAAREPGALPLLQYTLTELFERREGRAMTLMAYRAIGGLTGALVGRVDELYAGLGDLEQAAVRQIFLRLVVPGEEMIVARRRVPRTEVFSLAEGTWGGATAPVGAQRQAVQTVLELFGRYRLLTFDQDPTTGAPTVEIAHEALVAAWGRLRDWIRDQREDLRRRRRFRALAEAWEQAGRDPSFLARGRQLDQFRDWAAITDLALTESESVYLEASLAEWQAEQAREAALEWRSRIHLWALVGVLALAAIVAVALSVIAFDQQQAAQAEAAIALSLNLATAAQLALAEGDTDLALTLASEANREPDPPPQAQLMLAEAAYEPGSRRVLLGHDGAVEDVALAPGDEGTALSASADRTLILWDLGTGGLVRRFTGHDGAIHAVSFLPGGDRAISASGDGTLILWDVETGDVIRRFAGHSDGVRDVAVSPDCDDAACHALSASGDGTLILWDVETGDAVRHFTGHEAAVNCVSLSPDGRLALSGSADQSLILWDTETGAIVHHLEGWASVEDAEVEAPPLGGHEGPVRDVVFGSTGRIAYSIAEDRKIIYWDLESGAPVRVEDFTAGVFSLDLSADERYVLLGMLDSRTILWSLYYGQAVMQLLGHTGRVEAVAFTPGQQQAISGAADGSLRLWDLRSGAEMRRMEIDGSALDVSLSPDGRRVLLAAAGGDLSLWDYESGAEIRRLVGHTETPFAGVLFADEEGRTAISGAGDVYGVADDTTLRLWDVESGEEIHRFEGHTDRLWDIDVSPDGTFAVSGSHDGTLRLWNLNRGVGTVLADVAPQAVRCVAISPDGRAILIGLAKGSSVEPDYALHLLDRETGELVRTLSGHDEVVSDIVFSPDGRTALSGGHDKLLILWDVETGRELRRFVGHTGAANQVRFSPDGRLALSAGLDNVIILWDVETGAPLRRYTGHVGGVMSIAFTPGGRSFLSVALDDTVREWRIDATQEDLLAWIGANRYVPELTCRQRVQYHVDPLCAEGEDTP